MGFHHLHTRGLCACLLFLTSLAVLKGHELPTSPSASDVQPSVAAPSTANLPEAKTEDPHDFFVPMDGDHGLMDHLRPLASTLTGTVTDLTGTVTDTMKMPLKPLDPLIDPLIPILSIPDFDDGYLTIYYDNDLFGGTDENYTNGMRASWISMNRELADLTWIQQKLARFSGLDDGEKFFYNYGFSATHFMFTPQDILATEPILDERPYAGWLGLGFSLHAKNDKVLNSLELNLGIVGPNSLAENAQDFIHNARDIDTAKGWHNQLPSEFTANLFFTQKRRLFDPILIGDWFEVEGIDQWGFGLGNVHTDLRIGGLIRFGYNLPVDFSPSKLDVTAYTHQLFLEREELPSPWSVYGVLGAEGRATAYDVFLDGTAFSDSQSVDKAGFIGDLTIGLGMRYKKFSLYYSENYRTKEYRTQDNNQWFGSFQMSYAF